MSEEPRVYVRHLRLAGFCLVPGGRDWFNLHGLDWRDFVKNGIPVSKVERIDDLLCKRVCEIALKDQQQ